MKIFFYLACVIVGLGVLSFQNCAGKKFESQLESEGFSNTSLTDSVTVQPDCKFNRIGMNEGDTVIAYQSSSVPAGQQCIGQTRSCQNGRLLGTYEYSYCVPGVPKACLINGLTIPHGGKIKTFESALVPYGQTCDQRSEERTCDNGVLSGSFTLTDCAVDRAIDCRLGDVSVLHNTSQRFYQSSQVPFQQACVSELRKCMNGILSGTYTFSSCTPAGPQSCTLDGLSANHSEFRPFYDKRTVPFGQACPAPVSRQCSNGVYLGSEVYHFATCTTAGPLSCTFAGEPVEHNTDVEAFEVASVPYGQNCAAKRQIRHCNNGSLSGSYTFKSCSTVAASSCTTTDGVVIESGISRRLFKSKSVIAPDTCGASSNTETVTCTNGSLSGTARFAACTVAPVVLLPMVGNPGGSGFTPMQCAAGARAMGLAGLSGTYINRVGLLCSSGTTPTQVGSSSGTAFTMRCPQGKYFAGISGNFSDFVLQSLKVYCAAADGSGGSYLGPVGGGNGYTPFETKCPAGFIVSRLLGRTGAHVDQLQLECARVDGIAGENVDCQGVWQNLGCIDGSINGRNIMEYHITVPRQGNGLSCPNAEGDRKSGSIKCFDGPEP
jgi:hypothetical protein